MLVVLYCRLKIMGNTLPKFKHEDNPASFHEKLSTRLMTYLYLLVFNMKLLLVPSTLCYDWQVGSIPLVETLFDHRNLETLFFMLTAATLMCTLTYRHMVRGGFLLLLLFYKGSIFYIMVNISRVPCILLLVSRDLIFQYWLKGLCMNNFIVTNYHYLI